MNWFEKIFGFRETLSAIEENIYLKDGKMISKANNRVFEMGKLDVPTLEELRERVNYKNNARKIRISEIFGNVGEIHKREENKNALFQVASQFNLLEMISPKITPERGITIYQNDRTQGPSCAMACPSGTLYRNYYTKINTLRDIEMMFDKKYWRMENGYALFEEFQLKEFNDILEFKKEEIQANLRVGIQWDTEVEGANHLVSQIYCSALPVAYNYDIDKYIFEKFARTILEATYEATFLAGILNPKSNKVFLTFVGAGAFGNDKDWVVDAINKNIEKYKEFDLDITFITYSGSPDRDVQKMIKNI